MYCSAAGLPHDHTLAFANGNNRREGDKEIQTHPRVCGGTEQGKGECAGGVGVEGVVAQ